MPPPEVLVAMCAAREGVSPVVYWHTRTPQEFSVATLAWVESWLMPARVLTGSGKARGASRDGGRGPTGAPERTQPRQSALTRPRRDRHGRAVPQTVYDLRELLPLDRPWDPENVQMLKRAIGPKTGRPPPGVTPRRR